MHTTPPCDKSPLASSHLPLCHSAGSPLSRVLNTASKLSAGAHRRLKTGAKLAKAGQGERKTFRDRIHRNLIQSRQAKRVATPQLCGCTVFPLLLGPAGAVDTLIILPSLSQDSIVRAQQRSLLLWGILSLWGLRQNYEKQRSITC